MKRQILITYFYEYTEVLCNVSVDWLAFFGWVLWDRISFCINLSLSEGEKELKLTKQTE